MTALLQLRVTDWMRSDAKKQGGRQRFWSAWNHSFNGTRFCPRSRETLGNPIHLRDNSPVMTGQDWIDGRQATRLL